MAKNRLVRFITALSDLQAHQLLLALFPDAKDVTSNNQGHEKISGQPTGKNKYLMQFISVSAPEDAQLSQTATVAFHSVTGDYELI